MTILVAVGLVIALAVPAEALLVQVNGQTRFKDTFENDTLGVAPPDNPQEGSWSLAGGTTAGRATNAASPGPFVGSQYMLIPGGGAFHRTKANLTLTANAGATVNVAYMMYIPSGQNNSFSTGFNLIDDAGSLFGVFSHSTNLNIQDIKSNAQFGPGFTLDEWQRVDVDYVVNAAQSTYDVTLTNSHGVNMYTLQANANSGKLAGIGLVTADTSSIVHYVDVIPEPATMSLLALGALMNLRRRR